MLRFVVVVCAEVVHIMWVSERYWIVNVLVRRKAGVGFGS